MYTCNIYIASLKEPDQSKTGAVLSALFDVKINVTKNKEGGKKGRPRLRWIDNINQNLTSLGLTREQWT